MSHRRIRYQDKGSWDFVAKYLCYPCINMKSRLGGSEWLTKRGKWYTPCRWSSTKSGGGGEFMEEGWRGSIHHWIINDVFERGGLHYQEINTKVWWRRLVISSNEIGGMNFCVNNACGQRGILGTSSGRIRVKNNQGRKTKY